MTVFLVQHAEKQRLPGDPGLTELGRSQAKATSAYFRARGDVIAVYSSELLRARETAHEIASACGVPSFLDNRLVERMNWNSVDWPQFSDFTSEWERASAQRAFRPRAGDSSWRAGERMLAFLDDLRIDNDQSIVAVSHGGATVDLLRDLNGDEGLASIAPGIIEAGVPSLGMTTLEPTGAGWLVTGVGETIT